MRAGAEGGRVLGAVRLGVLVTPLRGWGREAVMDLRAWPSGEGGEMGTYCTRLRN